MYTLQIKSYWVIGLILSSTISLFAQNPPNCCTLNSSAFATADTKYSNQQVFLTKCTTGTAGGTEYILYDQYKGIRTRSTASSIVINAPAMLANSAEYRDCDNNWQDTENNYYEDGYALDAHWGASVTYDYFFEKHCRTSYDNLGSELHVYIFDRNSASSMANNGAWHPKDPSISGDHDFMYFYNDDNGGPQALTSLDYVAHEFGHGIANNSVPGGLNLSGPPSNPTASHKDTRLISEGLSDIWGICVKNYANNKFPTLQKSIWEHGLEPHNFSAVRRADMPWLSGYPSSVTDARYVNASANSHVLSTILTHWFYLLAHGDNSPGLAQPNPTASEITAGIQAAADILYRAETVYMHSNVRLEELREMTYKAALDLYPGNCGMVDRVLAAWDKIGVDQNFSSFGALASVGLRGNNMDLLGITGGVTLDDAEYNSIQAIVLGSTYALPGAQSTLEIIAKQQITNSSTFLLTTVHPVVLTAGNSITLTPNVHIRQGAKFLARIEQCGITPADIIPSRCTFAYTKPVASSGNFITEANEMEQLESAIEHIGQEASSFQVYPNPSTGQVHIKIDAASSTEGRLAIYDMQGRLLRTIAEGNLNAEVYNYNFEQEPAGVYMIQLISQEGTYTQKVVITK